MPRSQATSVDAYLAELPADRRAAIAIVRDVIRENLPAGYAESEKKILPALILCGVFGVFGAHRYYTGKIATGVLQAVTLGGFGVWWMVDFVRLTIGSFTDADGKKITEWV